MKRILLVILSAVGPLLFSAGVTTTVILVDKKNQEEKIRKLVKQYYDDKIAQYEEENKQIKGQEIDVVFLGDSLTDGYDVKSYYPQFNVLNRGIGGDTTTGLKKRLKVSVYDVEPKVATMLIGANNFHTMFDDYEDILKGFQENIPNTKIVLLSLTSMTKKWGKNNTIAQENNVKIKEYAEKYNYTFVDLYNPLLDPETNELKESYTTDGGHFTAEGYTKVTSIITPVLENLLN